MSRTISLRNSYKSFYSEGVASEHPDISGQEEFAKRADKELSRRRTERAKKSGPQLPGFLKSVRTEELELDEERKKMKGKDPCWKGYEMIGTKKKGGKEVPNCVPKEEYVSERHMTSDEKAKEERLGKKTKEKVLPAMKAEYGDKKGEQIYFAWKRKKAMQSEEIDYNDPYEYIIETLVSADFAEDYEAAEVMFEHVSDEFTSIILEEYIEEKARGTRKKTTVHAYDVDETLFGHGKEGKPNVQVHVKDSSGKRVQSLSNQEFNTHKLKPGHKYDFSEFQSAEKFGETSTPNKRVIRDIKRKIARGHNVHLITARSKFDDPSEFHAHLKRHGIDIDKAKIHYTGGMKGGDIGQKKVDVANAVARQSGAKKIHMYDDAAKVHKAFEAEKENAPVTKKIKTHMVAPDKKGESRVRSYQATKNEEMSAYEYWKQFINEDSEDLNEAPGGPARFWDSNMGRFVANTGRVAGDVRDVLYGDPSGSASKSARQRLGQRLTGKPVSEYPDQRAARIEKAQNAAIAAAAAEKSKTKPATSPVKPATSPVKPATSPVKPAAAGGGGGGNRPATPPVRPATPAPSSTSPANASLRPTPAVQSANASKSEKIASGMNVYNAQRKAGDLKGAAQTGMDIWKTKYADTLAKNVAPSKPSISSQLNDIRTMRSASVMRQNNISLPGAKNPTSTDIQKSQNVANMVSAQKSREAEVAKANPTTKVTGGGDIKVPKG